MQLKVEKADGSKELYLHTKVLGSLAAGLADAGHLEAGVAEQLAEAVTTFLRHRHASGGVVASDEVYAMIEAVLCDTGFEKAALALQEHRVRRSLKRRRVMVIECEGETCTECFAASGVCPAAEEAVVWDKSVVVLALEREGMLSHPQARAVAASVEEKVLGMGIGQVTAGLVRKLVGNELIALRAAEEALGSLRVGEKTRGGEKRKARTAVAATAVDAGLGAAREVAAERCPA